MGKFYEYDYGIKNEKKADKFKDSAMKFAEKVSSKVSKRNKNLDGLQSVVKTIGIFNTARDKAVKKGNKKKALFLQASSDYLDSYYFD